ncbi:MAG TPA: serine/threonine-protein kinase, partial [Polyangiaceae bacterium]|nr:serine/threonine-protein kinase [Polyangiaceae bacterium]
MKSLKSTPVRQPAATAPVAPYAGQLIGERYRLKEWLESGAMGSVWRAEQVRLRSPAAVKFLDPALIEYPEMQERFLQEARSAAAVQSAHVIQIFDYGREAGVPYIAMELLRGENLDARLARRGLLTPRELNEIFSQVARGLGAAHALGVIHRDVKPGNIFIAREGKYEVTKLIDFGIAKVRENALRVSQITGTAQGTVLGTPQYMSPEQLRGRSDVDYRTDLWALGIIACECLTGRHPFPGATIGDLSVQICTEQPPAPSTLGKVPAGFDAWFFKATSKDPLDRFESAAAISDALTKILLAPSERKPALLEMTRAIARRNWQELGRAWGAASRRTLLLSSSV